MTERDDLLASVANTIKDYRAGEIAEPTPEHVDRWIRQFGHDVQVPMLRELDHVFKQTYVSLTNTMEFLAGVVANFSCDFWREAHILSIQQDRGRSHAELLELFDGILRERCGVDIEHIGSANGAFIYLDEAIFTGDHVISDIAQILPRVPQQAQLHIIVMATHTYGEYRVRTHQSIAPIASKGLLHIWRAIPFENRLSWHNQPGILAPTDVLRPGEIGKRNLNERASGFFSSVEARELLETEFLNAGIRIINSHNAVAHSLKPLGYGNLDPGFGSLFVTYRNCPNNVPLALWWSVGGWYPLFLRKTNSPEW